MKNVDDRYLDGTYESDNPDWHEKDADWKAENALSILRDNGIAVRTVCDIGCGTGGVLRSLKAKGGFQEGAVGFDVSPRIVEMANARPTPAVDFRLWEEGAGSDTFDVALAMDVMEHVPDYLGFLKTMRGLSGHYVFHIPLDMNAQGVARSKPIIHARESVGHLHYFSRETAIASLEYAGFEIVDWRFTPSWETVADKPRGRRAFDAIRVGLFRRWPQATVNVLGGHSLLVLARDQPHTEPVGSVSD